MQLSGDETAFTEHADDQIMNSSSWQQLQLKPHQSKSYLLALGQAVKSQRIENDWADERGLGVGSKPFCGFRCFLKGTNLWVLRDNLLLHYKLCENVGWCLISKTLLNVEKNFWSLWGKNCASVVKQQEAKARPTGCWVLLHFHGNKNSWRLQATFVEWYLINETVNSLLK